MNLLMDKVGNSSGRFNALPAHNVSQLSPMTSQDNTHHNPRHIIVQVAVIAVKALAQRSHWLLIL